MAMTRHPALAALPHCADMKIVIGHIMDLQRRIYSPDPDSYPASTLSAKTISSIDHIPRPPLKMNHTSHALQQQQPPKRHPLIARPLRIHSPAGSPQPSINQAQHNRGAIILFVRARGDARETNHRLSGAADSRSEEEGEKEDNYRKPLLAFLR